MSIMNVTLTETLSELGIDEHNYRVLMLLPLVYVAWADGKMEDVEIERIDDIATKKLTVTPSGLRILDGWLEQRPSGDYFRRGLEELFLLAQTEEGEPLVHPEELHTLLSHAESIARATASALDAPTAVTPEEEEALREIAQALQLDNGCSWRRLLDELDAGPASIRRGRVPQSQRGWSIGRAPRAAIGRGRS
jgi:tellurite resistance protein